MVSANASSVAWTMSFLSGLKVGKGPLLNEYRKESPGKAHREAQEPECVNHDCGFWRREWRWIRRSGIDDGLGPGGIDENMIDVSEIERRGVLWTRLEALDGGRKKSGESS